MCEFKYLVKTVPAKKMSFPQKKNLNTKKKATNGRGDTAGLGKKENKVVRLIKRKSEADEVRGG